MAAIAKFVSYDGGIAFSEQVVKIQKRDQAAIKTPLDDVTTVKVRRPQEDSDGFIRVETAGGQCYRIFFEDDQFQEAVQFKRKFYETISANDGEYAMEPVQERAAPDRQSRQSVRRPISKRKTPSTKTATKKPLFRRWWFWAAVLILFIGVISTFGDSSDEDTLSSQSPSPTLYVESTPAENTNTNYSFAQNNLTVGEDAETSMETLCSLLEMSISENFPHYSISSDGNIITLNVWQDGVAVEAIAAHMNGADETYGDWATLRDNMGVCAQSLCNLMATAGRDDVVLSFNLMNDLNTDNILLSYVNTAVFYDFMAAD